MWYLSRLVASHRIVYPIFIVKHLLANETFEIIHVVIENIYFHADLPSVIWNIIQSHTSTLSSSVWTLHCGTETGRGTNASIKRIMDVFQNR